MAKLHTRTGDDGTTGLFGGPRVRKDDPRVAAYGDVDELNGHIGLTAALIASGHAGSAFDVLRDRLTRIQSGLFTVGAELATPPDAAGRKQQNVVGVGAEACARLETWIDEASAAVSPLTTFILPGGSVVSAHLHICRTVCRRAERAVVTLAARDPVNPQITIYLNRLSDLLFTWARQANQLRGVADVPWRGSGA